MEQLTDTEKRFLALAIQGLTFRLGPQTFSLALSVTEKLELKDWLKYYLEDWITCANKETEKTT